MEIFFIMFIAFMSFVVGSLSGEVTGREDVHTGKYICQTLPDNKIYCYENPEKNE